MTLENISFLATYYYGKSCGTASILIERKSSFDNKSGYARTNNCAILHRNQMYHCICTTSFSTCVL